MLGLGGLLLTLKKTRMHSILTGGLNLESFYTIPKMPVHFGCVETPPEEDIFMDQEFIICRDTGIIQIKSFPTSDLLYMTMHNDAIGRVWKKLYQSIITTVKNSFGKKEIKVLEIGGGSGKLASLILQRLNVKEYTMIEPNPDYSLKIDHPGFILANEYFEKTKYQKKSYDLILHSHVLEHVDNPVRFMKEISSVTCEETLQIFVIPNLKEFFAKKYTNALNFEHTFFLTEEYVDVILNNEMLNIESKEYFLDHSIIYTVKKVKGFKNKQIPNLFEEHASLLSSFVNYHKEFAKETNKKIKNFDGEVFLFGGHIFSQYLIGFGLDTSKIVNILDNSPIKIGKRLYGTRLWVKHPNIVKDKKCAVILKVASYRAEIVEQLLKINPNIIIIE
jgi:ubiquinone/menaquinone biosynthesis C-methylase UbiE